MQSCSKMAYESLQRIDFFPFCACRASLFAMWNAVIKQRFLSRRFVSTIELTREAVAGKPLEWHDLIHWLENGQKTILWRDAACAERYVQHQQLVARDYRSINDFIRIHYLKWNNGVDETTRKRIAVPSASAIQEPLLTPNDFPYYLTRGIEHWLIWCDPIPKMPEQIIERIIRENFPYEKFNSLSFVNPPRLRSVSDVFHAHIFTRKKAE